MSADLLIDGMLPGTGIRDAVNGGYVEPASLNLSGSLVNDIAEWQERYEACHFANFPIETVTELDEEGVSLAARAAAALPGICVGYYSNGLMKRLI
jgi:hypothetical protein